MENTISDKTLDFIRKYRQMEQLPLQASTSIVWNLFESDHLVSSWQGRKGNFGDFYLNLSHTAQNTFLEYWGISDAEGEEYVRKMAENEMAMLWVEPPLSIWMPHQLLKFFYNHGIEHDAVEGFELTNLPEDDMRYGNSSNWADYLISLNETDSWDIIEKIRVSYC